MSRNIQTLIRTLGSLNYLDSRLIRPSELQLRKSQGNLDDLVESIKQNGLLQPIVVRPKSEYFEVVAGNRRFAACRSLRITKILCMIKELSDKEAYEVSLVENVQRETLDPIEEAMAFENYVKKFGYGSTTELSKQIGKSEEYVSHRILLLSLPNDVLKNVSSRQLSPTVAEELIWLKDPMRQTDLGKELAQFKLSAKKVRQVVKLVRKNIEVSQAITEVSDSTPDFGKQSHEIERKSDDVKIISEATLVFKSTLIHLDSLIDRISDESRLKKNLIGKRYLVHQILDELIRMRNDKIKITDTANF